MTTTKRIALVAGLAVLSLSFSLPAGAKSSASSTLESKVALEGSLERRLQSLLTEILGTERLVVLINIRLKEEKEAEKEEVLPGVPFKETPASALRASLTMVASLSATIFLDESSGDADVELSKEVAGSLLGIDASRGDRLEIKKLKFRSKAARGEVPFAAGDLLKPPHLWNLLWLGVALTGVLLLPSGFKNLGASIRAHGEAVKTLQTAGAEAGGGAAAGAVPAGPAVPAMPALEMPTNGKHAAVENQPFGFIREHHLPRLIYLMKKSPPEIVAVVINYISPGMGSRILSSLEESVRHKVAAGLGSVTELTESNVRKIEHYVSSKIDFLVGGEDRLLEILDQAAPEVQEEILADIAERNYELSEQLRQHLVIVEDIADLSPVELQTVFRRVSMPAMATVLKAHGGIVEMIVKKLPAGLAVRLKQEVELARRLSPERLRIETQKLVQTLKQLSAEGWITLKKGEQ